MDNTIRHTWPDIEADEAPHLGSEYLDARTYLANGARILARRAEPKGKKPAKLQGANESDFGIPDQSQD